MCATRAIAARTRVFPNVEVDSARDGRIMYGLTMYLSRISHRVGSTMNGKHTGMLP